MTEEDATQFNRVLDALLQHPLAQRAAFIEGLRGQDAEFKPRLYAMLARVSKPDAWALTTLPGLAPNAPQAPRLQREEPVLDKRIGPYRLLERLGSGGMGVVWLARDMRQVNRRVAVKLRTGSQALPAENLQRAHPHSVAGQSRARAPRMPRSWFASAVSREVPSCPPGPPKRFGPSPFSPLFWPF